MTSSEIAALFAKAASHAARFRTDSGEKPQSPRDNFADSKRAFAAPLPEKPQRSADIIDELVAKAEPGLGLPTGPRFFAWVMGGSHPTGVAADMLVSAWGQNAGGHVASPSASAVEVIAQNWLLELLDLPRESSIGFVTGATMANFTCLAAARGEVLRQKGWDVEAQGLFGAPPISVLIGDDAHSTVFSALRYLGLGQDRVKRIATDLQGNMIPPAFAKVVSEIEGPAIVIAQAGQINTGGFDDFAQIIPLARKAGAWVHVDGAFGLWARASRERRHQVAGLEAADSWATDGHKWLQTPYDCGYAIVRNEPAHRRAMTIAGSYLQTEAAGERDPAQYVPELSRRARGFATWAMIKALGRSGIEEMVERNCRVAQVMAARLASEPGVSVVNDVVLNQAIIRFGSDAGDVEGDRLTVATIRRIQADGTCFASGASWRDRQVMRVSVTNGETTEADGLRSAEAMITAFQIVKQAD
jgi:glutamate/tyrosine decarboxylase-like PLP-dependent enzyme